MNISVRKCIRSYLQQRCVLLTDLPLWFRLLGMQSFCFLASLAVFWCPAHKCGECCRHLLLNDPKLLQKRQGYLHRESNVKVLTLFPFPQICTFLWSQASRNEELTLHWDQCHKRGMIRVRLSRSNLDFPKPPRNSKSKNMSHLAQIKSVKGFEKLLGQ